MKKKRFYQQSFGLMFVVLICLIIDLAGIYALYNTFYRLIVSDNSMEQIWLRIFCIVMYIFGMGLMTYTLINISKFCILFDQDSVFMPNDWYGRNLRTQYKTKVKYAEISKIELIKSSNNSLNKKINKAHFITAFNKPYLQLTLHNGQVKRFLLLFFTKKQWIKIVDELKRRLIAVGNNIELPSTAEMIKAVKEDKAFNVYESLADKAHKLCQEDSTGKLSDYLTYDEFCELFINTFLSWKVRYKETDTDYCLEQDKDKSSFYSEAKNFRQIYEYPEELLEEVKIEGLGLKAVWDDLYLY